ncbi:polysaccharide deacetylase family protein [Streptomyces sp. NPDC088745]|uniref:polysaccharide deacetylase family protein n=1 Tax=Streptomyces sp. NPDC088745 TaxID=3365884 RepID=UPI0037F3C063
MSGSSTTAGAARGFQGAQGPQGRQGPQAHGARVPILMYHAVGRRPARAAYGLSVSPEAFAAQMGVLAANGFTPLTTRELGAAWRPGRAVLPPKPVLITFDDGYEGVHRHALPVLAGHGFRSSLFVTTGWLRGRYEEGGALDAMLDWDQVRALRDAGTEIGGHSHSHPQLDQLPDERLRFELLRCRELVADELGRAPDSFAYPYGYSSRRVRAAVRDAGYAQALAVNNDLAARPQGPFALRRVTVRRGTPLDRFERMVEGAGTYRDVARERALTRGYAVVRRSRSAVRIVRDTRAREAGARRV